MLNDQALLDSFEHWRKVGYSVQTAMVLALAKHATNPSRPENEYRFATSAEGFGAYRYNFTNLRYDDLV